MKPLLRIPFLPRLLTLALPIALQALMTALLNLVDTVMIGRLGEVEIAAVALGNQIFFLLMLFLFGVGSGGAVFAAQFWGKRDLTGVHRALGISLIVALCGAALFATVAIAAPAFLLGLFTKDSRVIAVGVPYLRIVASSYAFTAISVTFAFSLRSVGDSKLPMYATAISIVANVVGNYTLIFGAFGFPRLGVTGAAVSTAIARALEVTVILAIVYRRKGPIAAPLRELFAIDRDFARRFLSRSIPVVANEVLWSTGFVMYTLVFGRMGTEYLAAYNISDTVGRLMLVLFMGTAQASAVLIGNTIGEGRPDEAAQIGSSLLRLAPIVSGAVGIVLFFAIAPAVPLIFVVGDGTRLLVRRFLRLYAVLMVSKVVNMHVIVGILRGGGDTRYALTIDILPLWLVGVPAAIVTGLVLHLPAGVVYLSLIVEETVRMVLCARRVASGKWVNDVTAPPLMQPTTVPEAVEVADASSGESDTCAEPTSAANEATDDEAAGDADGNGRAPAGKTSKNPPR